MANQAKLVCSLCDKETSPETCHKDSSSSLVWCETCQQEFEEFMAEREKEHEDFLSDYEFFS